MQGETGGGRPGDDGEQTQRCGERHIGSGERRGERENRQYCERQEQCSPHHQPQGGCGIVADKNRKSGRAGERRRGGHENKCGRQHACPSGEMKNKRECERKRQLIEAQYCERLAQIPEGAQRLIRPHPQRGEKQQCGDEMRDKRFERRGEGGREKAHYETSYQNKASLTRRRAKQCVHHCHPMPLNSSFMNPAKFLLTNMPQPVCGRNTGP